MLAIGFVLMPLFIGCASVQDSRNAGPGHQQTDAHEHDLPPKINFTRHPIAKAAPSHEFEHVDRDKNGIGFREWDAQVMHLFKTLDTDHDRVLSPAELKKTRAHYGTLFLKSDFGSKDQVTLARFFQAFKRHFRWLDQDKNKSLNEKEYSRSFLHLSRADAESH